MMSKQQKIKIGDYMYGDDWLCKVTAVRRNGLHRTQIKLSAVDNKEVKFNLIKFQGCFYSEDMNQFSRVEAPKPVQVELEA